MTDLERSEPSPTVLLPVSEAAPRLGLTPAGLRSRIRRGLVETRRGNQGQHLVECPRDPAPGRDARHDRGDEAEELLAEVDALRRDLALERLERARLEERLAGLERVHAAELGAREVTVADLRAELARLRRPFWLRWIGG